MVTPVEDRGIKISPRFHQQDWYDLNLSKNNIDEWNKAIEIFRDRIEGRYFKQIEILDKNKDRSIGTFSGFAIISITCLLIETLEQFWTGNIETSRAIKTGQKKKGMFKRILSRLFAKRSAISNDSLTFFNFFQRSEELKTFFNSKEKANIFYTKIRCGLLHQGQTKGKSLIHIREEPVLNWINAKETDMSIQRRLFVDEVRKTYEKYIEELQRKDNLNFKRKFERKMKYIVDQK